MDAERLFKFLVLQLPLVAGLVGLTWACFHYTHKSKTLTEVLAGDSKPLGVEFTGDTRIPQSAFLNALATPWLLLAVTSFLSIVLVLDGLGVRDDVTGYIAAVPAVASAAVWFCVRQFERPKWALPKWYLDECAEDERILAEWLAAQQAAKAQPQTDGPTVPIDSGAQSA
jgi:hypothetical protein